MHDHFIGCMPALFQGYKLVGIKVLVPSKQLAGAHYEEHAQRPFFPKLVNFLSSGAVVAMVHSGGGGAGGGHFY